MSADDSTPPFQHEQLSPSDRADFAPAASLAALRLRAEMLDWLRSFFRGHGYWEVETPILSHDVCVDAWLEPFCVPLNRWSTGAQQVMYLQTSPEFGMKRLLAAGAESIFQITRAFRQEESGRLHNPEFTIVEWYRVGETYERQMDFVEELAAAFQGRLLSLLAEVTPGSSPLGIAPPPSLMRPVPRLTYDEAFLEAVGERVLTLPISRLVEIARGRGISTLLPLDAHDRDGWLNLLFLELVEPLLARHRAAFVCDYPASQAALAQVRAEDPPVAERFELFLNGIEICNGYQELTDPSELRARIATQARKRRTEGRPVLPVDSRLLAAMEQGLPPCAGVALGFDRLLLSLLGAASLGEVLAFPFSRA